VSGLRSHPQIRYQDRRRYLLLIAVELDQCAALGDGNVSRAIAHSVRTIRRNPIRDEHDHCPGDPWPGDLHSTDRHHLDAAQASASRYSFGCFGGSGIFPENVLREAASEVNPSRAARRSFEVMGFLVFLRFVSLNFSFGSNEFG